MVNAIRTVITIIFLTAPVIGCRAQDNIVKKKLSQQDYIKWSTLGSLKLSPRGNFSAWHLRFENADTIKLQNLRSAEQFSIAGGISGEFVGEDYFVSTDNNGNVSILNFANGSLQYLEKARAFTVISKEHIFIHGTDETFTIYNVRTNGKKNFANVTAFAFNAVSTDIAIASFEKIGAVHIIGNDGVVKRTLMLPPKIKCNSISWQKSGNAFAIVGSTGDTDNYLGFYDGKAGRLKGQMISDFPNIGKNKYIVSGSFTPLLISQDGKRVLLGLAEQSQTDNEPQGFKIYNTHDKLYSFSEKELGGIIKAKPQVFCWYRDKGIMVQVGSPEQTEVFFNGSHTHAITSEPFPKQPQWEQYNLRDYYLTDLVTGKQHLLLKQFPSVPDYFFASPGGKYLIYFKSGHWWTYNLASGKHCNISSSLPYPVYKNDSQYPEKIAMFEKPSWTSDDTSILLSDAFDVWEISPNGKILRKLTQGRDKGTTYRMVPVLPGQQVAMNHSGSLFGASYDIKGRIIMRSFGNSGEGISLWRDGKLTEIAPQDRHIEQLISDTDGANILYSSEAYNIPAQVTLGRADGSSYKVFQTNSHHFEFSWGRSELISYSNTKGEKLSGALFYPSNYNPDTSYPMVVNIYEKRSKEYTHYVNPSMLNGAGFNISNFTSKGYFVLLPDITYTTGKPGVSALDCVETATLKALSTASIDKQKLALIGHSYGGYETAFIITHSKLFKTAIAGAAVTDLVTGYLYAGGYSGIPDYWRYEAGQLRMGTTVFENYAGFIENSPLFAVSDLEVPLLLWIGSNDQQVDTSNSFKMHLSMRRLQKEGFLLEYQDEEHIILDPKKQQHLTASIEGWIDHFLMGSELPDWFK